MFATVETILREYDPEHDLGEPNVTWAEAALAHEVQKLKREIERLKEQCCQVREEDA